MVKYYAVINRHVINKNRKTDSREPPIRVSKGKYGRPNYLHRLSINNATLVYAPDAPLPCGATVYLEMDELVST